MKGGLEGHRRRDHAAMPPAGRRPSGRWFLRPFRSALRGASRAGLCAALILAACAGPSNAPTLVTIATVNNTDMLTLKAMSPAFEASHPGIKLRWVVLEENILRQRQTMDVATRSGIFDVITTSSYEVPIWSQRGMLRPLRPTAAYAVGDLLPPIRAALSRGDTLYAGPFYGESSMTYYRRDLFARAGLTMPAEPTWAFVFDAARKLNDPARGTYGLCLRGKAGWGENMAVLTAMSNAYGARLFDMNWRPQLASAPWVRTVTDYVGALRSVGPPGGSGNGFNEMLTLFSAGKCAMWFDSTVAAASLLDPHTSQVADKTGFALAPGTGLPKRSNWLYIWAMAIPAGARHAAAAETFIDWATGPEYQQLLASKRGWQNVPPGTRLSFYANPVVAAQPYSAIVRRSILTADAVRPSVLPVPYRGVQYASIPEYQAIGTEAGQAFSAALNGATTPALAATVAQDAATRIMADRAR